MDSPVTPATPVTPEELYKPVTVGKSSGLVRKQSLMTRSIEEKKEHLFLKQAADYAIWISNYLGIPPMEPDLLTSLQNGIVLGLLIQKIAPEKLTDFKFPTNLKSANVFQAHENIKRFIKACEVVGVKPEDTFQVEDLLEGQNKLKVLRTLQCLRKIHEGRAGGYEYDKFEKANFDLDFLEGEKEKEKEPSPTSLRPRRNTIRLKVNESVKRRSMRLFQGPDGFSSHFDSDSKKKRADISDITFVPPPTPEIPKQQAPQPEEADPTKSKLPLKPSAEDSTLKGTVPFPTLEEGVIEIPILEKDHGESFAEPMDPSIMAHLLSRDQGDTSGSDDEPEIEPEETESMEDFEFEEAEDETEGERIIMSLKKEVSELQDLLKTQIVTHMRESELYNEQIKIAHLQLAETEKRAVEAEKRSRELEEKVHQLLVVLEERDQSLSLLSQLYNEQLKKVEEAVAQANSESQARSQLEAKMKAEESEKKEKKDKEEKDKEEKDKEKDKDKDKEKENEAGEDSGSKRKKLEKKARRKSYVARKPKNAPEDAKLTHLDELEKELGISSPITPLSSQIESFPDKTEEEPEEEPPKPKEVVEGPAGYEPFILPERIPSILRQATLWSHLPEVKAYPGKVSERERSRQEVIYELITTEEAYIADLELIIRIFMIPLYNAIAAGVIFKEEYELIFRNIQHLAQVNVGFFKDLKKRQEEEWPVVKSIADILLKHIVYFGAYAEYCGDQKRSTFELRRILNENAAAKGIVESCQLNPECRKLDIFAFLLLPMQRLTKYPLLLKNLAKLTSESDPDFDYIKGASTELTRLINAVDQYAHRRDELNRISEVDKQLNWSIVSKPVPLVDSEETGRYLVQEGLLTRLRLKSHSLAAEKKPSRKTEQLYCFFFNDMFIFTKQIVLPEIGAIKYVVQVEPLITGSYTVRNVPEATNGIGAKNVFLVSSRATGTIVLQASSSEEKEKWITGFRKEDLTVETAMKLEEATGTLRGKKNEPMQRYSSGDLLSPDQPQSPAQRHSASLIHLRSNSIDSDFSPARGGTFSTSAPNVNQNLTIEQLTEPEFDGWLKILTRGAFQTSSWKLRWCVLKDFCLYYFPDDHLDSKALGMIVLPSYRIVTGKESNKKNVFKIEHPTGLTKPLVCCADAMEYFDVWVQALTHATMAKVVRRNFWV